MDCLVPSPEAVCADVRRALQEDIGSGDITAALIDVGSMARATVISRESALLCGRAWFEQAFLLLDDSVHFDWQVSDGEPVAAEQLLCTIHGPARALLTGERTALNFLQTLSGTATLARRYVEAIGAGKTSLLDTRKTLPGLRQAQKYAVRCAGGQNHRMGLYDGVLIKENHIAAAGSIAQALALARQHAPCNIPVEVEVEDLSQVREALAAGADILLLDNMSLEMLREAVAITAGQARLEASGGITLDNIHAVADAGVDFISVGAITKHLQAVDLSMRLTIL
ncbi:MAG: carboxylating nicotinate-nucleotide diphosphorylase [Thiohalomonadaceae bacterium]